MAENAQQEKPKGGGNGKLIGTALILLPAIAVLMPSCIVLMVMMAPTIVIYALDRTREKYFAITVGLLNVCGAMPAEVHLWQRGQTYDAAFDIVGDPFYWLMAYGAASVGWVIYLGLPPIFSHYYGITSHSRLLNHMHKQEALVQSWGEVVAGEVTEAGSN